MDSHSPRRVSIAVDGLHHGSNPIPVASVVGGILVTGAVFGLDPATQTMAPEAEGQMQVMFDNVGRILAAAGGTWDDIARVSVNLHPSVDRSLLNEAWVRTFPDERSRPARQVHAAPHLQHGMLVQCDVLAVLA